MNNLDAIFYLVLSLKKESPAQAQSIPLLLDLAGLVKYREEGSSPVKAPGVLFRRINRRHLRLCRVQEDLSRLDLKKASAGASQGASQAANLEDLVFSQINFSRYREIKEKDFNALFPEGLDDFADGFFITNFRRGKKETREVIEKSYKKEDGLYKMQRETPLILSIMQCLETSLENLPLFTVGEIQAELQGLRRLAGDGIRVPEKAYTLFAQSLDGLSVPHDDGMTTGIFISGEGDLVGTFRPANKPWTRVLIPRTLL